MQRANKTINTKVGLDVPLSEQVRQRQVTLKEGKQSVVSDCETINNRFKTFYYIKTNQKNMKNYINIRISQV